MTKLIAFDQSTTTTGWCVMERKTCHIVASGVIRPLGDTNDRISETVKKCLSLCRIHEPSLVLIEGVQYQKNPKVLEILAKLAGVLEIMLLEKGYTVYVIKSSTWRSKVGIKSGKRKALKTQAHEMVESLYNLTPPEDECEAILFARAFAQERKEEPKP